LRGCRTRQCWKLGTNVGKARRRDEDVSRVYGGEGEAEMNGKGFKDEIGK
jgi:hypothetical protein